MISRQVYKGIFTPPSRSHTTLHQSTRKSPTNLTVPSSPHHPINPQQINPKPTSHPPKMTVDVSTELSYTDVGKIQDQLGRAGPRAFVQDYEGFIAQSKRAIAGVRRQLDRDRDRDNNNKTKGGGGSSSYGLNEEDEAQYKRMVVDMEIWIGWAQDQIRAIHERLRERRAREEAERARENR